MHALESWIEEKRSAWLYRIVSDAESGSARQVLFLELARAAAAPERLRIKAAETLGQIASPAAVPGLLELVHRRGRIFTSAEPTEIRIAAARALLAIGTPQAELGLRQIVADESRHQDRDALQRILDLQA